MPENTRDTFRIKTQDMIFTDESTSRKIKLPSIRGVISPMADASMASLLTDVLTPSAVLANSPQVADILSGTSGALALASKAIPYKSIAAWTHRFPSTSTDHWMDVIDGAVRGPNHRWLNHHPYDFFKAWSAEGATHHLKWADYLRHAALDSITVKGLPIFPSILHAKLVSLGIPASVLFNWTHVNIFDLTMGSLSVLGGGTHFVMAITGHLPWNGTETFLLTFGQGGIEILGGIMTTNPFLIAGGALDYAAGAISYWKHFHIPEPSIFETLAPGLVGGAISGSIVTATRLLFSWNHTTAKEKALIAAESLGWSTLMGALTTISPWLSLPIAAGYSAGKLAYTLAKEDNKFFDKYPISSQSTPRLCRETIYRIGGEEALKEFEESLHKDVAVLKKLKQENTQIQKSQTKVEKTDNPLIEKVFGARRKMYPHFVEKKEVTNRKHTEITNIFSQTCQKA